MESANCKWNPHFVFVFLIFADSNYSLRIPEQLAISACCGIRNKTIVPTKFTLQLIVRGIHETFVNVIHLLFGTCLKICRWDPVTHRLKTVRLSSAQFVLIMLKFQTRFSQIGLRLGKKCREKKLLLNFTKFNMLQFLFFKNGFFSFFT